MSIVAYYRVSTRRQGESGLGLEGQKAAVEAYAKKHGHEVLFSFTEIESGKRHENRPQLAIALRTASATKSTLVVAKLDRLARNVAFLSAMMESGVAFVACDQPSATKLTLHILAAVAEDELERISSRLKAAFAAGRAQGRKYGGANKKCKRFTRRDYIKGSRAAAFKRTRDAEEFRAAILPAARYMQSQGMGLVAIAEGLNAAGYRMRKGGLWNESGVQRLFEDDGR